MTVIVEVEIQGSEELRKEFERIEKDLTGQRLYDAWASAIEMLATGARERVPSDLGYLLASIEEEVIQQDEGYLGAVFSDLPYAPFQERGTDAYFPNLEALEEWAERHDTTAWVVAMAIKARGVPARRFFEESLFESEDEIFSLIGGAVGQIIEREY